MRAYGKLSNIFILVVSLALLGGCANIFGTSSGGGEPYFYAEFDDIPIPAQLSGIKETTIITTPSGIKSGLQVFKGRVEVGSLNSAMIGYMQRENWELRSATRGARSLMLFEKEDRFATIYILDGAFNTEMQVYVSPKITSAGRARISQQNQQNQQGNMELPVVTPGNTPSGPSSSFDTQYLNE